MDKLVRWYPILSGKKKEQKSNGRHGLNSGLQKYTRFNDCWMMQTFFLFSSLVNKVCWTLDCMLVLNHFYFCFLKFHFLYLNLKFCRLGLWSLCNVDGTSIFKFSACLYWVFISHFQISQFKLLQLLFQKKKKLKLLSKRFWILQGLMVLD